MNTISESFPFCYAIKNGTNVKLHILVKVPEGKKIKLPVNAPELSGQTKKFQINLIPNDGGANNAGNKYINYEFPILEDGETIDTIEVYTVLGAGTTPRIKTMKSVIPLTMDVVSAALAVPSLNGAGAALDTPYVCTKLIEVMKGDELIYTGFDAEVYILSDSNKQYTFTPNNLMDADKNTEITISSSGTSGDLDFSVKHTFNIPDVHTYLNGQLVTSYGPRKGKTKNRHHTRTPNPKSVHKPK